MPKTDIPACAPHYRIVGEIIDVTEVGYEVLADDGKIYPLSLSTCSQDCAHDLKHGDQVDFEIIGDVLAYSVVCVFNEKGLIMQDVELSAFEMLRKLRTRCVGYKSENSSLRKIAISMGVDVNRVWRLYEHKCEKITAVEYFRLEKLYIDAINTKGKL